MNSLSGALVTMPNFSRIDPAALANYWRLGLLIGIVGVFCAFASTNLFVLDFDS